MEANTPAVAVKKPSVIWLAIGIILLGGLNILGALTLLVLANTMSGAYGATAPTVSDLIPYVGLIVGCVDITAGLLIVLYKRLGLYMAVVSFVVALLILAYNVITENAALTGAIFGIAVDLIVLFFVYRYITHTPEKDFFK